ncbi:MAG: LacI family transcriptional regulator [Nocardioidaceae bacterium]|nr:LacI family transcriptional regulator [Nocardioidaceae bacterium]
MVHPRPPTTLADVAERAGVSRQTVSNAINNPLLLRPDTLHRVRSAIDALGYTPNHAARQLRTRASRLIGLYLRPTQEVTATMARDRFVGELVAAAQRVGYHVLLFSDDDVLAGDSPDAFAGYEDLLRSTAVDAFVVTDTYLNASQSTELTRRGAPFVAFGRPWEDPEAPHGWIDVDGAAGVRAGTEHLVDQGHERIAWVGWQAETKVGADRRSGWASTMAARDLPMAGLEVHVEPTVDAGRVAVAAMLDEQAPTAIVCVSDALAVGALQALAEHGATPGRDVRVIGFDDSQIAQVLGLTSVRSPLDQVASALVADLVSLLGPGQYDPRGLLLAPELVVRRT